MKFADIDGVTLHYRLDGPGDGPPLVLVNSLGTDARIWDRFIGELEDRYCVLSYDKRGHGLSSAPAGPYRLEDHLRDLLGLADLVGFDRFAVAGVSVGGVISMGCAARHPERVIALVLCDTAPAIGTSEFWNERIDTINAHGTEAIADLIMERWFAPDFRRERAVELSGWRNMLVRSDRAGYAATCATLRDTDLTAELAGIAAPALVVVGDADLSTPPDLVRAAAARIPGARFEIIDKAGHIPSIEQPAVLAGLVREFFKDCDHV